MVEFEPVNVPKPVSKGLRVNELICGNTYGLISYHPGYRSWRRYKSRFNGLREYAAKFTNDSPGGNTISQNLQVKGNYLVERIETRFGFDENAPSSTRDWKVVVTAV